MPRPDKVRPQHRGLRPLIVLRMGKKKEREVEMDINIKKTILLSFICFPKSVKKYIKFISPVPDRHYKVVFI